MTLFKLNRTLLSGTLLVIFAHAASTTDGESACVWAASNSLNQAIALYSKGDFAGCSALLTTACQKDLQGDATAHYYLANALSKMNKRQAAYKEYVTAKSLTQDGALASYCQQAIDTLSGATTSGANPGGAAGKSGDKNGGSSLSSESSAATKTQQGQAGSQDRQDYDALYPDPAKLKINAAALDTAMVTIVRRSENTNFVLYQIDQALRKLPDSVKQTLQTGGLQIIVSPTLVDARPELAADRPTAYVHGGGYENCPGFFDGTGKIYIPEKVQYRSNVAQLNRRVLSTILHEMGHAFDHYQSGLSRRDPFAQCYTDDMGHLTMTQKTKHYYYTQADAGPAECFAEIFSYVMNPAEIKYDADAADLAQCFPRCLNQIKKITK